MIEYPFDFGKMYKQGMTCAAWAPDRNVQSAYQQVRLNAAVQVVHTIFRNISQYTCKAVE
jgi:hypothetical protein